MHTATAGTGLEVTSGLTTGFVAASWLFQIYRSDAHWFDACAGSKTISTTTNIPRIITLRAYFPGFNLTSTIGAQGASLRVLRVLPIVHNATPFERIL